MPVAAVFSRPKSGRRHYIGLSTRAYELSVVQRMGDDDYRSVGTVSSFQSALKVDEPQLETAI